MRKEKVKKPKNKQEQVKNIIKISTKSCQRRYINGYLEHFYNLDRKNRLTKEIRYFMEGIMRNEQCLQESSQLRLKFGSLRNISCLHLCNANFPHLTHLDLYNNNIGDKGCQMLVKGDWKYMKTLQLGGNMITERGCFHLSHGNWKWLIHLDLNINPIGKKGFVCICNAFSFECKIYCDVEFGQFYL